MMRYPTFRTCQRNGGMNVVNFALLLRPAQDER